MALIESTFDGQKVLWICLSNTKSSLGHDSFYGGGRHPIHSLFPKEVISLSRSKPLLSEYLIHKPDREKMVAAIKQICEES